MANLDLVWNKIFFSISLPFCDSLNNQMRVREKGGVLWLGMAEIGFTIWRYSVYALGIHRHIIRNILAESYLIFAVSDTMNVSLIQDKLK